MPARQSPRSQNDDRAGEVTHPPVLEQAAAPNHVNERVVDRELPGDQEEQVRPEPNAVRESASDQSRRDDGEHQLVRNEHHQWDL
jgi:hypothetical protein